MTTNQAYQAPTQRKTSTGARARRRRQQIKSTAIVAGIAVAFAGMAAWGGAFSSVTAPPPPDVTAVLVGPGPEPSLGSSAFAVAEQHALAAIDQLLIAPLTNSDTPTSELMTGAGANQLERDHDLTVKKDRVEQRDQQLLAPQAVGTAVDGLHALAQHLDGLPHTGVDVLITGNVLAVTPQINLVSPVQRGDPARTLTAVRASGLLPSCQGWRVHIVGGSAVDGRARDTALDVQAREVWRQIINSCGGQLAAWDTSQLATFPVTTPITAPPTATACQVRVTFRGDVLFAGNQSDLRSGADRDLDELRRDLLDHPAATITVDGYTADTGQDGIDDNQLSQDRANTVRTWLTGHGVPSQQIRAAGYGASNPVAPNDTPEGRALNRRVEAVLSLHDSQCSN